MLNFFWVAFGALLLYLGGEFLVRNATRLAAATGMSPLVIGLTVVAFGTSSPELATTLIAAIEGSPEAAVGNAVGSNIANLSLILGLTALLYPLRTRVRFLRRELPFMIGVGALLIPLLGSGVLGRLEGLLLMFLLGVYLWVLLRSGKADEEDEPVSREKGGGSRVKWVASLGVLAGAGLLVAGAHTLIEGAIGIAQAFDVPERVVGLTLVAVGGSLPELAGCLVAALKRQGGIVLGNLVGSNVLNILFVLGLTALVRPLSVEPETFAVDLLVMLGLSLLALPFLFTGRRLGRREGAVLLAAYCVYVGFLYS